MFKAMRLPRISFERWYWTWGAEFEFYPHPSFGLFLGRLRVSGWIGHAEGCECDRCLPF